MSREGRSQPIQPFATHGFLGNAPANGTLPFPRALVVENDDRRRKTPPLEPVIFSGATARVQPPAPTSAPLPVVSYPPEKPRPFTLPSFGTHGFLGNVPANGVLPAPMVVVEPPRPRRLPEQPVAFNGLYAVTTAPAVTPPPPTVIPLGERARVTPPPTSSSGFDLVTPPEANVVEPKDRRRQTPDPVSLIGVLPFVRIPPPIVVENDRRRYPPLDPSAVNAALLAIQVAPQVDTPPGPFVVPIEQRRQLLDTLGIAEHGFVDPGPAAVGTTPPPLTNLDREDQRKRYLPLDPLVLSGVLIPFVPPPPVVVQAGTDWAASIASFY